MCLVDLACARLHFIPPTGWPGEQCKHVCMQWKATEWGLGDRHFLEGRPCELRISTNFLFGVAVYSQYIIQIIIQNCKLTYKRPALPWSWAAGVCKNVCIATRSTNHQKVIFSGPGDKSDMIINHSSPWPWSPKPKLNCLLTFVEVMSNL